MLTVTSVHIWGRTSALMKPTSANLRSRVGDACFCRAASEWPQESCPGPSQPFFFLPETPECHLSKPEVLLRAGTVPEKGGRGEGRGLWEAGLPSAGPWGQRGLPKPAWPQRTSSWFPDRQVSSWFCVCCSAPQEAPIAPATPMSPPPGAPGMPPCPHHPQDHRFQRPAGWTQPDPGLTVEGRPRPASACGLRPHDPFLSSGEPHSDPPVPGKSPPAQMPMCGWRDPPRLNLASFFTLTLSYRRQKRLAVRHTSHTFCFRATLASSAQMCILHRRAGHTSLGEAARGRLGRAGGWAGASPLPTPPRTRGPAPPGCSPLLVVLAPQAPQVAHGLVHAERVVPRLGEQVSEAAPGFPGGNCRGRQDGVLKQQAREHVETSPRGTRDRLGQSLPPAFFDLFMKVRSP